MERRSFFRDIGCMFVGIALTALEGCTYVDSNGYKQSLGQEISNNFQRVYYNPNPNPNFWRDWNRDSKFLEKQIKHR